MDVNILNITVSPPASPTRYHISPLPVAVIVGTPGTSGNLGGGGGPELVPTVFTWTGGGKQVYITGTFNDWKEKIPLTMSERDFTLIKNLPPGLHLFVELYRACERKIAGADEAFFNPLATGSGQ